MSDARSAFTTTFAPATQWTPSCHSGTAVSRSTSCSTRRLQRMARTLPDRPFRAQGETRDITFQIGYEGNVPVVVEVEALPATVRPGFATALDIHVRASSEPLAVARCTVTMQWPGGAHRWRFEGSA